ncbi:uncharacterized protein V6R79_009731 [Siganus canaliculatus]
MRTENVCNGAVYYAVQCKYCLNSRHPAPTGFISPRLLNNSYTIHFLPDCLSTTVLVFACVCVCVFCCLAHVRRPVWRVTSRLEKHPNEPVNLETIPQYDNFFIFFNLQVRLFTVGLEEHDKPKPRS